MYLNTTLPCYLGLLVGNFLKLFYTFLKNVLSLNCELLLNCNDKLGLPIEIRVTTCSKPSLIKKWQYHMKQQWIRFRNKRMKARTKIIR